MNVNELTKLLSSLGWATSKDEVGDKIATYALLDRKVDVIYGLRNLSKFQKLEFMRSTSTDCFSNACRQIRGRDSDSTPLVLPWNDPDIRANEILEKHVKQASDEAISWAQEQDLDKALQDYAALPTTAPGTGPVCHLAALVLLGNVEKLECYQASFEAGDRLGFVNYITKGHISRAITLVG